jgi:lysophospholipase L1-like esterase
MGVRRGIVDTLIVVLAAAGAIAVSLWLTPMQQVSTAGQTVEVGVSAPSWSLSGPGQLDLFGQSIPTAVRFEGPIRPKLTLTHITLSEQLGQFVAGAVKDGGRSLEDVLVGGWQRFFVWQVIVVAAAALGLSGAAAGWLRRGGRGTIVLMAGTLVLAVGVDLGAVMVTAYSTPAKLSGITSLQELVGDSPPPELRPARRNPAETIRNVVVVGDSTAAGLGNRPLDDGDADDKACGRSQDSFAVDLANVNGWNVTNLACSSATIRNGLLGPQDIGGRRLPAQLDDKVLTKAQVVIVSIGANDVEWTTLLQVCAVTPSCSTSVEQAFFQQQLAAFSSDYLQLLGQLQLLPTHPVVIINQYYDPVPRNIACLKDQGMTKAKQKTLQTDLVALNTVLADGAKTADFATAVPDFTGHGLCSALPYVQGLKDAAPFHPTPSGALAIALADEHALRLR